LTVYNLISHLNSLGVKIRYEDDQLRIIAPKGALNPDLRAEISQHKAAIIALLNVEDIPKNVDSKSIRTSPLDKDLPLSFAQQRLWFLDQYETNLTAYNLLRAFRIIGPLDENILKLSLTEIIRRHETLRTTFVTHDDKPVQIINSKPILPITKIDLQHLSENEKEEEARRITEADAETPFDLTKSVLRCFLIKMSTHGHILVITTHHIASDGWSHGVFNYELSALYNAFSDGEASPLVDNPIQYRDFSRWQQEWIQGGVQEEQLKYWRNQLAGIETLELPTDRHHPLTQSYAGTSINFEIPENLAEKIRLIGKKNNTTLFMTLLTAFNVLLSRYSGQLDICIGTPIANRHYPGVENLIGFFVNMLVIRTDLSGKPNFQQLLHHVRETTLTAYTHQDLPFEKLVGELILERDLVRSPLFQVAFSLFNKTENHLEFGGLQVNHYSIKRQTARFELDLVFIEKNQGLQGILRYNTVLFKEETIQRMTDHFLILLEGLAGNPEQQVHSLSILPESEYQKTTEHWNDTQKDYPREKCVHLLFEEQVEKTPDKTAFTFENKSLSYRNLNNNANQVANLLRKSGVGPEKKVGILMEPSLELVVGLLGIVKAGGTYVPLDPDLPPERLSFMTTDSQISVLLTQDRLLDLLPDDQIKKICLDTDWDIISLESQENLRNTVTPLNLIYVIYTSGSTGKPKGVQIPHRAVVNLLHSMTHKPGLTDQDILLSVTTVSFDISVLELFLPLMVGAQVLLVSREVATDGMLLAQKLKAISATVLQATPATWRILLDSGWSGSDQLKILCGGEAWDLDLAEQLLERCASLWNMYGPTETTVYSTGCKIETEDEQISIGRPIANTQVYILDSHFQLVPVGVTGTLFIGGDGLARGYQHQPGLTSEKFVPNPFNVDSNSRIYNTGDRARYLPDGRIEYLGRIDFQVKIRGFRVELGEIETALGSHSAVKDTVVIARDYTGDRRLVAYIVLDPDEAPITVNDMYDYLKERLPIYMVPSVFHWLEEIPLTPSGKIAREILPMPNLERPELKKAYVAPESHTEEVITRIWSDVIGLEKIGVNDNFFELGGHSLLATQIILRVKRDLDVKLPLKVLFESPTIRGLANEIQDGKVFIDVPTAS